MMGERFEPMHIRGLSPDGTPNMDRHARKSIGVYFGEARALEGMRRVAGQPAFATGRTAFAAPSRVPTRARG